jgi:hypothetical protein
LLITDDIDFSFDDLLKHCYSVIGKDRPLVNGVQDYRDNNYLICKIVTTLNHDLSVKKKENQFNNVRIELPNRLIFLKHLMKEVIIPLNTLASTLILNYLEINSKYFFLQEIKIFKDTNNSLERDGIDRYERICMGLDTSV